MPMVKKTWVWTTSAAIPGEMCPFMAMNSNPNAVSGLSWSRDGAYIAIAAGSPFAGGSASIYAYPARSLYGKIVPTYYPSSVAFSPSGSASARRK